MVIISWSSSLSPYLGKSLGGIYTDVSGGLGRSSEDLLVKDFQKPPQGSRYGPWPTIKTVGSHVGHLYIKIQRKTVNQMREVNMVCVCPYLKKHGRSKMGGFQKLKIDVHVVGHLSQLLKPFLLGVLFLIFLARDNLLSIGLRLE